MFVREKPKQLQASFVDGVWLMGMACCSVVVVQMILEAEMLCLVLAGGYLYFSVSQPAHDSFNQHSETDQSFTPPSTFVGYQSSSSPTKMGHPPVNARNLTESWPYIPLTSLTVEEGKADKIR